MKKLKAVKVKISRGGYKPSSKEEAKKLVAEFLLGTIGISPTQVSQQLLLNITNYNYLTSVAYSGRSTDYSQAAAHKTVKELNEFCRKHKIQLGLLIMPHTSASEYDGDVIVAIPWEHVKNNPQIQSAVNSLFESVEADGYPQYVTDAKTVEG
ncbi:hypothetical protein pEaSNUABM14_00325 [Erwinia phage pEa_SNUABM_14]|uniref:Uncharacterized protein n=1 Tax=Erwinia phage pEa_SNUABM_7 TaxID=2866695 RepID=A0AAE7WSP4_9CAUD|nr:hypothetical protein MPK74_gp328 [Erwinia phage pEa_SNUABM_7]QYW03284.1 hypothetical protein pEaSNUABM13_00326 [Erwinia phage pEa_SNUABM_13]QYW03625.1 hypothetical protein pEaSNUABM34_00323 [Erwinia phage pEa_SNUABM_34]QYW03966.1 hypothetical protein pEaSNUABM45_00323 [Erwinia phage pEa_SNUABM_45]QYW04307.1 hypothetical protein pEaSNUABM46_00323 [Erwinia phage pEa_SNUABM_46]QYW04650.1 hypothetical protein pEaSNUABM14_00325 [Erwinia phage pEa_SNUABM_14]QYW05338.1 hypothetical protein pEaSNU